jgi:OOP family OmpA-OmpF porin
LAGKHKNNHFKDNLGDRNMKKNIVSVLCLVAVAILATNAIALEILTEEDLIQKVVTREDIIKTADNFIILFDTSNSMNSPYQRGGTETKYTVARRILKQRNDLLPDLGYNSGLYLFTPWQEVYPLGPYDRDRYNEAVDSLPAQPKGPTLLPQSLRQLDSVLQGVSGKTVVFIFSDGTYSQIEGMKVPEQYTAELAAKYNVCFYLISYASRGVDNKRLEDMAKANQCSRVISFKSFIERPEFATGALYVVKSTEVIETITESKIVGVKIGDILFPNNDDQIGKASYAEMDELGDFLQKNPQSYVYLAGYTDNTGTAEYNQELSRRRAENVAAYLISKWSVEPDRIVTQWYGKTNPVASNSTNEGRQKNRRVEIAIGGL